MNGGLWTGWAGWIPKNETVLVLSFDCARAQCAPFRARQLYS